MLFYNKMEELDDSWIRDFENIEKKYKFFYKEDIRFIKIHFIYINDDFSMEKIKETKLTLTTPNFLSKEEMISLIKHNNVENHVKYSLFSILKYNIDLDADLLKPFLKSGSSRDPQFEFLTSVCNINSITFKPSIYMFQDLNELLFLFSKSPLNKNTLNKTKRVFIRSRNKTIKNT